MARQGLGKLPGPARADELAVFSTVIAIIGTVIATIGTGIAVIVTVIAIISTLIRQELNSWPFMVLTRASFQPERSELKACAL